jgi:hypothetical protein
MIQMRPMTEERLREIIAYFKNRVPFKDEHDIPDPPVVPKDIYDNVIVPEFIRCGAIPKDKLVNGKTYLGSCRNSSKATWVGDHFFYERRKWGSKYNESINHFQDDDGSDLFVPIKEID